MRGEHETDLLNALALSQGVPETSLADQLYTMWFTGWQPPAPPRGDAPGVVARVRAAHHASAAFATGWVALALDPTGGVIASRGGEQRWLAPGDFVNRTRPAAPVRPGDLLSVTCRQDQADEESGWWYTWSSEAGQPAPDTPLLRLYWHAQVEGIMPIIAAITAALEPMALPYLLKCPVRQALFGRQDALVLYLPLDTWMTLKARLRQAHAGVAQWLAPPVPPLTLRLGRGVAAAEDPGSSLSYGQSRTIAVAEGIRAIRSMVQPSHGQILDQFALALRRHRIDPAHPYQHIGSLELAPW